MSTDAKATEGSDTWKVPVTLTERSVFDMLSIDDGYPTSSSNLINDVEDTIFPLILEAREQFPEMYHSIDDFNGLISDNDEDMTNDAPDLSNRGRDDTSDRRKRGSSRRGEHKEKSSAKEKKDTKNPTELLRDAHISFLSPVFNGLSGKWTALDASRPWLIYWTLNALSVLGVVDQVLATQKLHGRIVDTLKRCIEPGTGAFGGGPGQKAHMLTTYAAINSLAIIGTKEAYSIIDRQALHEWLKQRKCKDGSFVTTEGGESDVRTVYAALSICKLLALWDSALLTGIDTYITSCQSHEGGFACVDGNEAHGGYTFCALAGLLLAMSAPRRHKIIVTSSQSDAIDSNESEKDEELFMDDDLTDNRIHVPYENFPLEQVIDVHSCTEWVLQRECQIGGGFQGRINKLIDGCYSFWQGGTAVILETYLQSSRAFIKPQRTSNQNIQIFGRGFLQEYILVCCQDREIGGLIDKPNKYPDYYHTCYNLSGLSCSQHRFEYKRVTHVFEIDPLGETSGNIMKADSSSDDEDNGESSMKQVNDAPLDTLIIEEWDFVPVTNVSSSLNGDDKSPVVLGPKTNIVEPVHPLHNILPRFANKMRAHFEVLPRVYIE